ncbi:MAG: hypothetical protein SGPRY_007873 [Prymnesium sp.]
MPLPRLPKHGLQLLPHPPPTPAHTPSRPTFILPLPVLVKRLLPPPLSLCLGLSANELLPGVKLAKEDEPSLSHLLPEITSRLAAAGELSAMVELAERKSQEGKVGQAVELLVRALLEKLGHMQMSNEDSAGAAESFAAASEAAMEAGKPKLAMKLSALAEESGPACKDGCCAE